MLASRTAQYTFFVVMNDMRTALLSLNIYRKTKITLYLIRQSNVIYATSIYAHFFIFSLQI